MSLSLTGGRFKGAVLRAPVGKDLTRPTSGKVRQALFNILRDRVDGSTFLDLYAGSGSVGLEALSWGCGKVTLVENHPLAFRALEANAALLVSRGVEKASLECLRDEAVKFCRRAEKNARRFDIVFVDPPFTLDFNGLLEDIKPLMAGDGTAVVQFPSRNPPLFTQKAAKVYAYGESSLAVFEAGHC